MEGLKMREITMYNGKVWGYEVSEEAKKYGYLDYRTLSKMVGDCVLCNNIASRYGLTMELENGCDYDEETDEYSEVFQWYIISDNGASVLERYTDELVYYDSELDIYVWGVTHWGTSWDYVLTDIKLVENKEA